MQDTIENLEWEIWKDIPGYEWYYMVSNMWRVKSLDRYICSKLWWKRLERWLILKILPNARWYLGIVLYMSWYNRKYAIHRLVASAFLWLDIDRKDICVCHKDDNPSNNKLDNLFLWTQSENIIDMYSKCRRIVATWEKHYMFWRKWLLNPSSKPIKQISKNWEFIKEFASATEAWYILNISSQNISSCCTWRKKYCWWYKWEFAKGIER